MEFATPCMMCPAEGETKMCVVQIPHFKETVLMVFSCASCGYRNTEVKAGGAISPVGKIHEVHVISSIDLNRDVLKVPPISIGL